MLLYAQPLSRILRLSAGDLSSDEGGQTWLRLGYPPSPVPAPFDALLHQLADTRHYQVPANHASDWLFPGRNAGQPAAYHYIAGLLRDHGLPLRTARISALRQARPRRPRPRRRRRPRLPPHHHHPPARQRLALPGAGTLRGQRPGWAPPAEPR